MAPHSFCHHVAAAPEWCGVLRVYLTILKSPLPTPHPRAPALGGGGFRGLGEDGKVLDMGKTLFEYSQISLFSIKQGDNPAGTYHGIKRM